MIIDFVLGGGWPGQHLLNHIPITSLTPSPAAVSLCLPLTSAARRLSRPRRNITSNSETCQRLAEARSWESSSWGLWGGDVVAEWSENLRWLKEVRINVLRPFLKIGWFLKDSIKLRLQSYHVLAKYFSSVFFSPWHVIHFQQAPWKWGKSIIYTSFCFLGNMFHISREPKGSEFLQTEV